MLCLFIYLSIVTSSGLGRGILLGRGGSFNRASNRSRGCWFGFWVCGKTAYHWLGMLPRAARISRPPLIFESHLFRIALQYRSGLPCVDGMVAGARCRCKTRQAKTGKRSVMDKFGFHLSACPWGGWRISRHDKANHEVGCGVREAGNDATWTDAKRLLDALPTHRKEKGSRTRMHRIPDIIATDQNNERAAFDLMCTLLLRASKPVG